jgi:hypothetical protein
MGMAFQSISEYNAPPTFQTLVSKGEETKPIFSFKLAPCGSELFLGGANPELYEGDFTWVPLTTKVCLFRSCESYGKPLTCHFTGQGYWQAPFDCISVFGIPAVEKTEAIYDTGTTQILGDPVGIQRLYDEILGSLPAKKYGDGFYTSTL